MQLRIAGFMSGKGTNLRKIIDIERKYKMEKGNSPYEIVVIFSNNYNSNAVEIGKDYDIPVIIKDIKSFYIEKNKNIKDMDIRAEFDKKIIEAISPYKVSIIAYAGYMSIVSHILTDKFIGISVHPADLSIMDDGNRKYIGSNAVRDAIIAGEKYISSTSHLVDSVVDQGSIFMISQPIKVETEDNFDPQNKDMLKRVVNKNQEYLKRKGDWIIFPLTLLYFAKGRFELDSKNNVFFDGEKIPYGIRWGNSDAI